MGRLDHALPALATAFGVMVVSVAGGFQIGSLISEIYAALGAIVGFFFGLYVLDRIHNR